MSTTQSIPATYNFFDRIAGFFTSLGAVQVGMFAFISYRFFEVRVLFERHLPSTLMDSESVWIASRLISIVIVFSMILISVNLDRFRHERSAVVFGGVLTLFINAFFWETWKGTSEEIIFKNGIAIFTAFFDLTFSYLFISKWNERKHIHHTQHTISELEQKVSETHAKASESQAKLSEIDAKIEKRQAMLLETTCPGCGRQFTSRNGVNAHAHRCGGCING